MSIPNNYRYISLALVLLAALICASGSEAAPFEKMVMPGEVIEGHAKYENECRKCHRPFSKEAQDRLCLDCHEKVARDVEKKVGFHGLSPEVKGVECRHCHTDHKGREKDIVILDREIFNHESTDFPLKGGHASVRCADCHEKGKKWREAPVRCIKCHKEDDVHKENLGTKCADCHSERSWRKFSFDHGKTDFALKGKHEDVACVKCHPNERYKDVPTDCIACHRINDTHRGGYGTKCADCHSPRKWEKVDYDHGKTNFPLKDRHAKVECIKCHAPKSDVKKTPKTCSGCHKNDDDHKGRYGEKCKSCHTPKGWSKTVFDHDDTDFALKGKHEKVDCVKCHREAVKEESQKVGKAEKTCIGCHKGDDVHDSQVGERCERCHDSNGWRKRVRFEHDITRFPLIGLHAVAPCESCHSTASYGDASVNCTSCHTQDDKHKKKLGPECGACHNPNGWRLWEFNHDTQTDFRIDGAHEDLKCVVCHDKPVKKSPSMSGNCSGCHYDDDVHNGRFGLNCTRCHVTRSFRDLDIM